jgi:L-amino acid N-acyltransferase YncA
LVAVGEGDAVLGWVAVTAYSSRPVYAGVVELGVYVAPEARGRGVGRALMLALIDSTEAAGIWTLQAGVFPENKSSISLHRSVGFREVGTRERIACHYGQWRDVLLMERRSPVAGNGNGTE